MLKVVHENDYTVVIPELANLDSHVAADFKNQFTQILEEDAQFILLDLEHVTFMDSSGLAAIVFCFQLTNIKDKLAICGAGERVMKLFELTQMSSVVQIYATREGAIDALSASRKAN